jgi:hypothetical protein
MGPSREPALAGLLIVGGGMLFLVPLVIVCAAVLITGTLHEAAADLDRSRSKD